MTGTEGPPPSPQPWGDYLGVFHAERPGITEDILHGCVDDTGANPYDWLAEGVPAGSSVLDLGCGSGPMRTRLTGSSYVGIDRSLAELGVARRRSLPVAQGDATRLPCAVASFDIVVVSMALMLVPLAATLAEVHRVLRPGGRLVATTPSTRPIGSSDRLRYARLCLALRHPGLTYPNDDLLAAPEGVFAQAGLTVVADERRSFSNPLPDPASADRLLASLYLPGLDPARLPAGHQVVRGWVGSPIATPIRRLIATR